MLEAETSAPAILLFFSFSFSYKSEVPANWSGCRNVPEGVLLPVLHLEFFYLVCAVHTQSPIYGECVCKNLLLYARTNPQFFLRSSFAAYYFCAYPCLRALRGVCTHNSESCLVTWPDHP